MSSNITEKIALVLKDTQNTSEEDRTRALERLFQTELGLRDQTHLLDYQSLAYIHSYASENVAKLPTHLTVSGRDLYQEPHYYRALCYALAVYQYFRSKSMIPYQVGIKTERNQ